MELEEYLASGPPFERPIVEAALAAIDHVGPIHIEPVSVGIFLKRAQTFAELRPMTRWETLSFFLDHRVQHERITRKVNEYNGRFWHIVRLDGPEDVDDRIVSFLEQAYARSPE